MLMRQSVLKINSPVLQWADQNPEQTHKLAPKSIKKTLEQVRIVIGFYIELVDWEKSAFFKNRKSVSKSMQTQNTFFKILTLIVIIAISTQVTHWNAIARNVIRYGEGMEVD